MGNMSGSENPDENAAFVAFHLVFSLPAEMQTILRG